MNPNTNIRPIPYETTQGPNIENPGSDVPVSAEVSMGSQDVEKDITREQELVRRLGLLAIEKEIGLDDNQTKAIATADKYYKYPEIAKNIKSMENIFKRTVNDKTDDFETKKEVQDLLANLVKAADFLDISLQKQKEYGLVDHRWVIGDRRFVKEALAAGRRTLELDVRIDEEFGFWISHATGAKKNSTPPHIHEMTTAEMEEKGNRPSLEEVFKQFAEYKDEHKLVLELKTLGPDVAKFPEVVGHLKKLIEENKIDGSVAVASISPGILMAVHKEMPDMPLI